MILFKRLYQRGDSLKKQEVSETITENIFRNFYGAETFIEKSAIPNIYKFVSKKRNRL